MYKKRRSSSPVSSLSDVLPELCRQLSLDEKVREMTVLGLWSKLVDVPYRTQSKAVKLLRKGNKVTLLVRVASSAVAGDLTFQLDTLRAGINGFTPQTGIQVDRIQLSVGSLS